MNQRITDDDYIEGAVDDIKTACKQFMEMAEEYIVTIEEAAQDIVLYGLGKKK
jgi:hypothetical protein